MAELGGIVTATDACAEMLERARARTSDEEGKRVRYKMLDVTKGEAFEEAKEVRFSTSQCV